MKPPFGVRALRFRVLLSLVLVVVLGMLANGDAMAAPAQCTPGSCDDNNVCTIDTCDPVQGCLYAPVNCDDGSVCTVDTCSPTGGPGIATLFMGHDISQLERQYQKNGTFVQTWGATGQATGAAIDANGIVYVCNPAFGNNVIERRGPGNTNLGSITATVNNKWIEDLGNYGGGYILASTYDGGIYRINTTNGADTLMFATGHTLNGVTYDGTDIWTTGGTSTTLVYRRDLAGNVLATFNTGQTNYAIGYDPDDGTLWIGHAGGLVTHYSQVGALLGGFSTAAGGQVIDGLELANMPLAPGCQNTPVDCNDNDFCKDDACDPTTGCYNPPHSCNDNNPCTDDACSSQTGCVYTLNNALCEDSNLCTVGDTCSAGACLPGGPAVCNDNNVCTTDSCDPRTGCAFVNNNNFCSDGNLCTVEDMCVGGTCQGGIPVVCNDNNPCTADSCIPAMGCVYANLPPGSTCDDGNACTQGDVCVGGTCHGAPVICQAPDQCHVAGGCDPLTGACTNPPAPNGTACNDGNPCTAGDVCVNGVCGSTLVATPLETRNMAAAPDKVTYSWSLSSDATTYDGLRGVTGFPVGSSSGGEVCYPGLTEAQLVDAAHPAPGNGFWYLSRARNPCGPGPWGAQSDGTARITTSCP